MGFFSKPNAICSTEQNLLKITLLLCFKLTQILLVWNRKEILFLWPNTDKSTAELTVHYVQVTSYTPVYVIT